MKLQRGKDQVTFYYGQKVEITVCDNDITLSKK